jgi:uncharacterized membrane protein
VNWQPLFGAPVLVQLHASAAMAALLLGAVQLYGPKGTPRHRAFGYVWLGLLLVVSVSSFWIHEINQWRGFSLIHLLSILSIVTVVLGLHAVRIGNIRRHRTMMLMLFWCALVTAGLFTLMPGRILYRVVFS